MSDIRLINRRFTCAEANELKTWNNRLLLRNIYENCQKCEYSFTLFEEIHIMFVICYKLSILKSKDSLANTLKNKIE